MEIKIRKQTAKWTTKDKRKIRVCDMTDSHLLNTIKWIYRKCEKELEEAQLYCPSFQGEMAQYFAEQAWEQTLSMTPIELTPPIFTCMLKDAVRRGLEIPGEVEDYVT